MEDNLTFLSMEEDLHFSKMGDYLNFFLSGRQFQILQKMEDILNIFKNGRRPPQAEYIMELDLFKVLMLRS